MRPHRKRRLSFIRVLGSLGLAGVLLPSSAAAAADLSLSMTAAPSVGVGEPLNYGIAISNVGADPARNATVSARLPAGVDVIGATTSRGRCTTERVTRCEFRALGPGNVVAIVVSGRPTAPGRLSASARTRIAAGDDGDPANNFASVVSRATLIPGRCANTRLGTPLNDLLTGTSGGDAVFGGAGNDRLDGGPGGDCLHGQRGRDRLIGSAGADRLSGGRGPDRIDGDSGLDRVTGGSGADVITGAEVVDTGRGNDTIRAPGNARVRCGPGRDTVRTRGQPRLSGCERVVALPETRGLPLPQGGAPSPAPRPRRCRRRRCRRGGIPSVVSAPTASGIQIR